VVRENELMGSKTLSEWRTDPLGAGILSQVISSTSTLTSGFWIGEMRLFELGAGTTVLILGREGTRRMGMRAWVQEVHVLFFPAVGLSAMDVDDKIVSEIISAEVTSDVVVVDGLEQTNSVD